MFKRKVSKEKVFSTLSLFVFCFGFPIGALLVLPFGVLLLVFCFGGSIASLIVLPFVVAIRVILISLVLGSGLLFIFEWLGFVLMLYWKVVIFSLIFSSAIFGALVKSKKTYYYKKLLGLNHRQMVRPVGIRQLWIIAIIVFSLAAPALMVCYYSTSKVRNEMLLMFILCAVVLQCLLWFVFDMVLGFVWLFLTTYMSFVFLFLILALQDSGVMFHDPLEKKRGDS